MHKLTIRKRKFKSSELVQAREPSPGPRLLAPIAAGIVSDLRFRRKVQRLHAKGPRVLAGLLPKIGAEHLMTTVIDQTLDRYLALPDEALDATGARDFPLVPIHGVRR